MVSRRNRAIFIELHCELAVSTNAQCERRRYSASPSASDAEPIQSAYRLVARRSSTARLDGLVRWSLLLRPQPDGWGGDARYRSDALVFAAPPYHHVISLQRRRCTKVS